MFDFLNYAVSEIKANYSDSWWWRQRLQTYMIGPTQAGIYGDEGIDVMAEDWDNLLVLDACRHDIFEEVIGTTQFDEYRVVRSRGSATPEWIQNNFTGNAFGDTVYVTANPWISKFADDSFHAIENIWMERFDVKPSTLDDSPTLQNTGADTSKPVDAETVTQRALATAEEYPDKRMIVHYFQPHAPYTGNSDGSVKPDSEIDTEFHPGKPLCDGAVDRDEVWSAYQENLEYVWHHAKQLAEELSGKTVITSDHGEFFGEWQTPFPIRGYDHPIGLRHPVLVDVPWAVVDGERKEITDKGTETVRIADSEVNDRLKDLGYKPE